MRALDPAETLAQPRLLGDARTRVLAGRSGPLGWEMWLREPPTRLSGLVAGLFAIAADGPSSPHRVLPTGELVATFNLGAPQRVIEGGGAGAGALFSAAFVSGIHEGPVAYASALWPVRFVAVRFRPLGALAFFGGLPMVDLANQVVDLESVLARRAGVEPLRQRLLEAPDLGVVLDLVEGWLAARVLAGPPAHPATQAALARLRTGHGDVRIRSLARDVGVSSRRLGGLFHDQVGVLPKSLARLLRLERALGLLAGGARGAGRPGGELAEVALACGYYDQPHLNRDFRDLAGLTPAEFRAIAHEHDPGAGWVVGG